MSKRTGLLASAIPLCLGLVMLLPATGSAAIVFGSPFTHEPANSGECALLGQPCTIVSSIHPLPGSGDPDPSGAPANGVVTKVRLRARVAEKPTAVTFLVANQAVSSPSSANGSLAAVGPTVTLGPTEAIEEATGETPIREFDVRMPVLKGQQLAIEGTDVQATYNQGGDRFSFVYVPRLALGQTEQPALETTGELLIQGTLEPDADGDGFGDETQDQCPMQRTTQGPCDTTAPQVSAFRVHGGRILYTLSEPGTVGLRLAKKRGHGFKAQGRAFAGPGSAGANQRALPRAKKLAKGGYRLTLTAADPLGNRATYTTRFRIK